MKLNTYLNFGGNCEQALHFYEQHLGAKLVTIGRFGDMPGATTLTPERAKQVMHARIMFGDTMIMASDGPMEGWQPMRSAYLSLSLDSDDETERIYALLSDGGEIFMAIGETFFAHRFAMFRDKYGVNWMLIHEKPMPRGA